MCFRERLILREPWLWLSLCELDSFYYYLLPTFLGSLLFVSTLLLLWFSTGLQKIPYKSLILNYHHMLNSIHLSTCFLSIRSGFVFIVLQGFQHSISDIQSTLSITQCSSNFITFELMFNVSVFLPEQGERCGGRRCEYGLSQGILHKGTGCFCVKHMVGV